MTEPETMQTKQPRRRRKRELSTSPLEGLSWSPGDSEAALSRVFQHVRGDALAAIEWYVRARRPKRWIASSARNLAIVMLSVAAILPLIEGLGLVATAGTESFSPLWISLAIAVAAGAVTVDRALGSSSGWIRCIKTEQQLRDALEAFELDWESERATWQGSPPGVDSIRAMLQRAKEFAAQVNTIIQEETNAWVEEFQGSIKHIEEALKTRTAEAKARTEAAQTGAFNLIVTNGDQCDANWTLSVDDRAAEAHTGRTAAIPNLPAGVRVFRVRGLIKGAAKQAELAATVPAGGAADGELTLT